MEEALDQQKMRLWIGFMSGELFDAVDMSQTEFEADHCFEVDGVAGFLPYALFLVDVANDVFAF